MTTSIGTFANWRNWVLYLGLQHLNPPSLYRNITRKGTIGKKIKCSKGQRDADSSTSTKGVANSITEKIFYVLGCTTTNRQTEEINPFPICKRNKTCNTISDMGLHHLWPHTLRGIYYSWFYHTCLIALLWPSLSFYRLFRPHGPFLFLWYFQDHPWKYAKIFIRDF